MIDRRDAQERDAILRLGLEVRVEETLMRTPEIAANLARSVLELAGARF